MSHAPWMRSGATAVQPLGAGLRRAASTPAASDANVERTPWLSSANRGANASGAGASCAACAEAAAAEADGAARGHDQIDPARLPAVRAEAMTAARAEAASEIAALRERMSAAVTAVEKARGARDAALTETIVDVALGLCAELAPAAAAIDRRALGALVRDALNAVHGTAGARDIVLRLRAEDAAVLGGQLPSGIACEVAPDMAPGEIWIDAPRLVIDATWPTRLAALREPLLALLRDAEPALELATDARAAATEARAAE